MRLKAALGAMLGVMLVALPVTAQQRSRPSPPPADQIASLGRPGWMVDANNGCWVWHLDPRVGETVTWAGGCPDGPAEGRGTIEWNASGSAHHGTHSFTGTIRNGRLEGQGTHIWPNGDRYDGAFRGGRQDGRGITTFANGDRYEGEFREDRRAGYGIFTWSNGDRYEGEWRMDRPHGLGYASNNKGSRTATGTWVDGCSRDSQGQPIAVNRLLAECE